VGPAGSHDFKPDSVKANVGDTIYFEFRPVNHSVVMMDPSAPCIPFNLAQPESTKKFWWSGFFPLPDRGTEYLSKPIDERRYLYSVTDEDPMYFYCSAPGSCITYGMVGVINPGPRDNITAVQAAAKLRDYGLTPGEPFPDDGVSRKPDTPSDNQDKGNNSGTASGGGSGGGLGTGAIVGIAIGGIAALALVGLLFFFVGRKKSEPAAAPAPTATEPKTPMDIEGTPHTEYPPTYYTDPRYSMLPPGSPEQSQWSPEGTMIKSGHGSVQGDSTLDHSFVGRDPNRMSELASQNYDPVEMYAPNLSGHAENPHSPGAR